MAQSPVLRLDAATTRFGDRAALDDVSFAINSGDYVSLLGPSGAGKTALLRAIAGFEAPELAVHAILMSTRGARRVVQQGAI